MDTRPGRVREKGTRGNVKEYVGKKIVHECYSRHGKFRGVYKSRQK